VADLDLRGGGGLLSQLDGGRRAVPPLHPKQLRRKILGNSAGTGKVAPLGGELPELPATLLVEVYRLPPFRALPGVGDGPPYSFARSLDVARLGMEWGDRGRGVTDALQVVHRDQRRGGLAVLGEPDARATISHPSNQIGQLSPRLSQNKLIIHEQIVSIVIYVQSADRVLVCLYATGPSQRLCLGSRSTRGPPTAQWAPVTTSAR